MSRTYLMHSYADQRTHEFFLSRDYPPAENLTEIFRTLTEDPVSVEELRAGSRMGEEEFDKALEKLEIHGGARTDFGGNVMAGGTGWKKTYMAQALYRAEQMEKVLRFTTRNECRMAALVRHFGDVEDAGRPCGVCDVCDPAGAVLRLFRRATQAEREMALKIVNELRGGDNRAGAPSKRLSSAVWKATGTLQRSLDAAGRLSRGEFDALLGSMVQASLIEMEDAEYEKDREIRPYRKVRLTEAGCDSLPGFAAGLLIGEGMVEEFRAQREPVERAKKGTALSKHDSAFIETKKAEAAKVLKGAVPTRLAAESEIVAVRLREWRAVEAKRLRVPAYVVMHDRTVVALAEIRPRNPKELLAIDGIGPAKLEKFGDAILGLCEGNPESSPK
jgi:superfamily II DNA helicase RecQ